MPTANIFKLTPFDNNYKVNLKGAVAYLWRDSDQFGSAYNQWTTMSGDTVFSADPATGNATITEPGDGTLHLDSNGAHVANRSIAARRNNVSYADADIVLYYSKTNAADIGLAANGQIRMNLWRSLDNSILFLYRPRDGVADHALQAYKCINGAYTALYSLADLGVEADIWFRIKRVANTQTFTIYYALADPIATPANWVQVYNGVVNDAVHFNSSHLLYPIAQIWASGVVVLAAELDFYDQLAADENRFWPDSPEIYVIDNALVEWAFDAGLGKAWVLTGASDNKTEPGTSTVKYKVGWSDNGTLAGTTWVDAVWQTIAQVNANAAAGLYDGHRYLHVQTQFNSDSTDQPTLTDFSITGGALGNYNLDEVVNNLDETTHNLDEVTNNLDEVVHNLDVV